MVAFVGDGLWAMWAKSDACGLPHSLVGHLLDTGAVGELIWEQFLAPQTRGLWDAAANGRGREILVLACVLHDIGKATPAFQTKDPELWAGVLAAGLEGQPSPTDRTQRQHWRAGAWFLRGWLKDSGADCLGWIAAVIEGHHGRHESNQSWSRSWPTGDGDETWQTMRIRIAEHVLAEFGISLDGLVGVTPTLATQLGFAGHVVMADWVASSDHFPGLSARPVGADQARARALQAWRKLGFAAGWSPAALQVEQPLARFSLPTPRPLQQLGIEVARSVKSPGLLLVEAPMGEGKTEAGLAMAEVLAAKFGCSGVVFAMPTQGTTDTMYARVSGWAASVDPAVPVSLLHGKAMMNEAWRELLDNQRGSGGETDEFGMASVYGEESEHSVVREAVPPQWVLGRHRGLLSHVAVATVDQVLYAATRTKFVSLRHAGLAGKVLIIDEVHSYDVYTSTFLEDLLKWCAEAQIPVILMSATLAPSLRERLLKAFSRGLPGHQAEVHPMEGYPRITTVTNAGQETRPSSPYRADMAVQVEVMDGPPEDLERAADRIDMESGSGGCVLVILNTVGRAQTLYRLLTSSGVPSRLLHGRLTTATRADRTGELVDLLGGFRTRQTGRPERLVVVATQIAEQSFDVDADLLVTDIAPMDLLLQRVGRLHRHQRPATDRPQGMQEPRVLVLGVGLADGVVPALASGPVAVYGSYPLLRSAGLIKPGMAWLVPSQVPSLVARAYDPAAPVPDGWEVAMEASWAKESEEAAIRAARAATFQLSNPGGLRRNDLAGLHEQPAAGSEDEARTVRDGEPTTEVALVVRTAAGYESLDGTPLGPNGERCSRLELARKVWGDTVRVRDEPWTRELRPLPGWLGVPEVSRLPALLLDDDRSVRVPGAEICYHHDLGLQVTKRKGAT